MKKNLQLAIWIMLIALFNPLQAQDWEQTNGPNGGTITGLTISGNSTYASIGTNIYYKEAGGVFRTDDNGLNWMPMNTGLLNTNIKSVYTKDSVLFAGAIAGYDGADAGVFRSFNQGVTWENCGLTSSTINCIIHQGDYIFAGLYTGGVYRSSDNGNTWVSKSIGLATGEVQDFATNNNYIFVVRNKNVYRSNNFGDTWTAINTGLPSSGPFRFIVTIASKGDTLYAGTSSMTSLLDGVYISTNNGANWALTSLSNTPITELFTRGNDVYAAIPGVGVKKSSDFGVTWNMTTLPTGQNCFIANSESIFSGNGNIGVFRSNDEGQNWNLVDHGMRGQCIRTMGSNSNTVFGGTDYCGIYKTTDNGANWVAANNGIANNAKTIQTLDVFGSNLFITVYSIGIETKAYRSNDNGENWNALNFTYTPQFYAAIGETIFASLYSASTYEDTLQIWRSSDAGITWELTPGTGTSIQFTGKLATIGANLFLFTNNKVYRSVDNANSWTEISDLNGVYIVTVCDSKLFCSTTSGIYKSDDLGHTWVSANFSQQAMHLVSNGNKVFAEINREIYVTINYGNSWVRIDNETIASTSIFPYVYGYALAATNDYLFTGVGHRSVYRSDFADFTAPSQPSAIAGSATPCIGSSQNYSVTNVPGVTYTWQFPSDWVITSGGTTNSVTVTIGSTPGIVLVTPSNIWGTGPAQFFIVTPNSNPPGQPSAIAGLTTPLEGAISNYSVINDPGVSYTWTFPSGWVQTAGGNTNSVSVLVGGAAGNIQVTPFTACGTGTLRTLAVTPVPSTLSISTVTIPSGQTNCYNAVGTIYVAGNGATFTVQAGGSATMIAGERIIFLPGTTVQEGGYLHGYISTEFCTNPTNPVVSNPVQANVVKASIAEMAGGTRIRIYPNPADNHFTLELLGAETAGMQKLEIYSLAGMKVFEQDCSDNRKQTVFVTDLAPGVYVVNVLVGGERITLKLIKL